MRHEGRDKPILDLTSLKQLINEQEKLIEQKSPDTLGTLTGRWRPMSPEWKRLAPSTQRTWGNMLDKIEAKWGSTPLSVWSDTRMTRKVVDWRDFHAETPRTADFGVQVLRSLLEFGRLRGMVSINVATNIPQLYRGANRAEIIWSDDDLAAFGRSAKILKKPYVYNGAQLAALTGLRREDLLTLHWGEVFQDVIVKKAAKASRGKRRTVTIPILDELRVLLKTLRIQPRAEGVDNVLTTSRGTAWTPDAFSHAFANIRDHAKIMHTEYDRSQRAEHIHDLRGTFCTKLFKRGLTDQEVADIMGWAPDQVRGIRRSYIDPNQLVVAISDRLRGVV